MAGELPALTTLNSASEINAYIENLAEAATTEIVSAQPGWTRSPEALDQARAKTGECLARGVRIRTIYQHAARFNEPMKEYVRCVTELGGEFRTVADSHFDRMVIIDRKVAVISTSGDHASASAVTDPGVVGFLLDLYERAWSHGKMFNLTGPRAASSEVVPEIRSRIRNLLMAGHSGAYIARRVGLRKRAYDNHVAAIKAELGATNLVQLGVLLAQDTQLNGKGVS
ncbi:hypothetical protein [Streptomyces sp. ISL-100]|uniref:hypothetical protein n=1 Tax=Streptomyces sp. ISL-100 TaxID=2819173 RepID=UPI001BE6859E|nr:hypothetical protein [Streptomyces sp. ISL-100]MBT2396898.1 hypothetical protein [Streptomyces sp. ISL-100]